MPTLKVRAQPLIADSISASAARCHAQGGARQACGVQPHDPCLQCAATFGCPRAWSPSSRAAKHRLSNHTCTREAAWSIWRICRLASAFPCNKKRAVTLCAAAALCRNLPSVFAALARHDDFSLKLPLNPPCSCSCSYVIVPAATGPEAASAYMLRVFSSAPVVLQGIGRLSTQRQPSPPCAFVVPVYFRFTQSPPPPAPISHTHSSAASNAHWNTARAAAATKAASSSRPFSAI